MPLRFEAKAVCFVAVEVALAISLAAFAATLVAAPEVFRSYYARTAVHRPSDETTRVSSHATGHRSGLGGGQRWLINHQSGALPESMERAGAQPPARCFTFPTHKDVTNEGNEFKRGLVSVGVGSRPTYHALYPTAAVCGVWLVGNTPPSESWSAVGDSTCGLGADVVWLGTVPISTSSVRRFVSWSDLEACASGSGSRTMAAVEESERLLESAGILGLCDGRWPPFKWRREGGYNNYGEDYVGGAAGRPTRTPEPYSKASAEVSCGGLTICYSPGEEYYGVDYDYDYYYDYDDAAATASGCSVENSALKYATTDVYFDSGYGNGDAPAVENVGWWRIAVCHGARSTKRDSFAYEPFSSVVAKDFDCEGLADSFVLAKGIAGVCGGGENGCGDVSIANEPHARDTARHGAIAVQIIDPLAQRRRTGSEASAEPVSAGSKIYPNGVGFEGCARFLNNHPRESISNNIVSRGDAGDTAGGNLCLAHGSRLSSSSSGSRSGSYSVVVLDLERDLYVNLDGDSNQIERRRAVSSQPSSSHYTTGSAYPERGAPHNFAVIVKRSGARCNKWDPIVGAALFLATVPIGFVAYASMFKDAGPAVIASVQCVAWSLLLASSVIPTFSDSIVIDNRGCGVDGCGSVPQRPCSVGLSELRRTDTCTSLRIASCSVFSVAVIVAVSASSPLKINAIAEATAAMSAAAVGLGVSERGRRQPKSSQKVGNGAPFAGAPEIFFSSLEISVWWRRSAALWTIAQLLVSASPVVSMGMNFSRDVAGAVAAIAACIPAFSLALCAGRDAKNLINGFCSRFRSIRSKDESGKWVREASAGVDDDDDDDDDDDGGGGDTAAAAMIRKGSLGLVVRSVVSLSVAVTAATLVEFEDSRALYDIASFASAAIANGYADDLGFSPTTVDLLCSTLAAAVVAISLPSLACATALYDSERAYASPPSPLRVYSDDIFRGGSRTVRNSREAIGDASAAAAAAIAVTGAAAFSATSLPSSHRAGARAAPGSSISDTRDGGDRTSSGSSHSISDN